MIIFHDGFKIPTFACACELSSEASQVFFYQFSFKPMHVHMFFFKSNCIKYNFTMNSYIINNINITQEMSSNTFIRKKDEDNIIFVNLMPKKKIRQMIY